MKEKLATEIIQQMLPYLDNAQMKQLREVIGQTLFYYDVTDKQEVTEIDNSDELIGMFIAAKRVEDALKKRSNIIGPRLTRWYLILKRAFVIFRQRICVPI